VVSSRAARRRLGWWWWWWLFSKSRSSQRVISLLFNGLSSSWGAAAAVVCRRSFVFWRSWRFSIERNKCPTLLQTCRFSHGTTTRTTSHVQTLVSKAASRPRAPLRATYYSPARWRVRVAIYGVVHDDEVCWPG
jgi:hypothetical protein